MKNSKEMMRKEHSAVAEELVAAREQQSAVDETAKVLEGDVCNISMAKELHRCRRVLEDVLATGRAHSVLPSDGPLPQGLPEEIRWT